MKLESCDKMLKDGMLGGSVQRDADGQYQRTITVPAAVHAYLMRLERGQERCLQALKTAFQRILTDTSITAEAKSMIEDCLANVAKHQANTEPLRPPMTMPRGCIVQGGSPYGVWCNEHR